MKNIIKEFDAFCREVDVFCREHETTVAIIGCVLSFMILKAAGAF